MARTLLSFQRLFCAFCLVVPLVMLVAPKGTVVVTLAMAVALFAAWRLDPRELRLPAPAAVVLLALLVLWAAVASLWSFETGEAIILALRLAALLAAGLWLIACAGALAPAEKRRAATYLLAGVGLAVALLLLEFALGDPLGRLLTDLGATERVVDNRFNRGATYLAILAWPLSAAAWPWLGPVALAIPAALLLLFLPLESLAAVASLGATLAFVILALIHLKTARRLLTAGTLVAILAAPLLPVGIERDSVHELDFLSGNARHRLHIWSFTSERIAEAPAFGWGFNASRAIPSGDVKRFTMEHKNIIPLHPHNAGLQVWLELGLVGALLLAGLAWVALRGLARLPRIDQTLGLATFSCAFVIASVSYGLWQNQWVATLMMAAALFQVCRSGDGSARPSGRQG